MTIKNKTTNVGLALPFRQSACKAWRSQHLWNIYKTVKAHRTECWITSPLNTEMKTASDGFVTCFHFMSDSADQQDGDFSRAWHWEGASGFPQKWLQCKGARGLGCYVRIHIQLHFWFLNSFTGSSGMCLMLSLCLKVQMLLPLSIKQPWKMADEPACGWRLSSRIPISPPQPPSTFRRLCQGSVIFFTGMWWFMPISEQREYLHSQSNHRFEIVKLNFVFHPGK